MSRIESIPELYFASRWKYKAEGNVNIILTYVVQYNEIDSYALKLGTVLRLRKSAKNADTNDMVNKDAMNASLYVSTVIAPLLGEYVGESILLEVQPKFLREIANLIYSMRPAKRLHKDIDFTQRYAILISDHTIFDLGPNPSLSIELKPKWVFLPTSPHISPENSQKLRTCRFCMHQHYKLLNKSDERLSTVTEYCPLDLFSLVDERMNRSIKELLKFPGHTLKLFLRGEQLQVDKEGWQRELCKFFELDFSGDQEKTQDCNDVILDLLHMLLSTMFREEKNFLNRLKHLQSSLDELDIEGIYKYYVARRSNFSDPTIGEWKMVVDEYLRRIKDPRVSVGRDDDVSIRQRLYEFLISATLKDCSIMMTFKKSTEASGKIDSSSALFPQKTPKELLLSLQDFGKNVKDFEENSNRKRYLKDLYDKHSSYETSFNYKIFVIDLDPKLVSNIPHYHELDAKIVENYTKNCKTKKTCVE
ncbi:8157_t:CDS:2 [Acaulospora morrowiae]|uniref:Inositol-pentakisphosphate 2-kinase n=1 Tax=Acaulospora morrowiae TaxID=94023 RepID=A0A9N9AZ54_9GLOM|nr:8157_t:CDS:2 [Acaulospora morrowiae]